MFGLGVPELILILVIGLVIFGPGKLPDVGRALGKSIREFRSANKEGETIDATPEDKKTEQLASSTKDEKDSKDA